MGFRFAMVTGPYDRAGVGSRNKHKWFHPLFTGHHWMANPFLNAKASRHGCLYINWCNGVCLCPEACAKMKWDKTSGGTLAGWLIRNNDFMTSIQVYSVLLCHIRLTPTPLDIHTEASGANSTCGRQSVSDTSPAHGPVFSKKINLQASPLVW